MAIASFGFRRRHAGLTMAMLALAMASAGTFGCTKPAAKQSAAGPRTTPERTSRQPSNAKTKGKVVPKGSPRPSQAESAQRATSLYNEHCAGCHGDKGDGKGLAARFLFPKPRDFRAGRFRLISTTNGIPSRDDLDAVLVRGMPGSAMIPWAHLSVADRKLLVDRVLEFRRDGARDVERLLAEQNEEEISPQDLEAAAERAVTAGEVFRPAAETKASPKAVARGKELYVSKGCAACHGEKGKGDGQQKMVDAEGLPTRPRDLTRGIFKGTPDFASVYRRLWLGLPGTPMPSSQNLTAEQVADMVHFVLSLSDEATRAAAVLKRNHLVVQRVDKIPAEGGAKIWKNAPPVRLAMTPLWWRDDADPGLEVQALHDGTTMALRLSWRDDSADLHASRSQAFEDGVAVELYQGNSEPFVGMGGPKSPVDVWYWDADRQAPAFAVEDQYPNTVVDIYPFNEKVVESAEYQRPGTKLAAQPLVSLPAVAAGNQIVPSRDPGKHADLGAADPRKQAERGGSDLAVGGPGSVTFRLPKSQLVQAHGEWKDNRWTVVMTRALAVANPQDGVSLSAGGKASIAFAVWDGSHRDRDGQKLFSIWQDLLLEK